jgi:hypothetical protein
VATKNEWLGLVDVAGLEVEALYGGFAGEPFGDVSGEYVFVARRAHSRSERRSTRRSSFGESLERGIARARNR